MGTQEGEARIACCQLQRLGGPGCRCIALRLDGQASESVSGVTPEGREGGCIRFEVAGGRDRRRNIRIHVDVPACNDLSLNIGAGDGI